MSYVLPLGPYHPALEEPVHVKLLTEGEIIKDSEVYIGYNHRGIEKLTETRNFIQTITLVERVCGICSHSHAMTYCLAIEDIAGMEVPKRGQYIRVILSELERLHSHYLWLGLAAHIIIAIGNLVCPAEFDIGEVVKVALLSIPEGDDKVVKYPLMFSKADALILTKYDMIKYFKFN